MSVGKNCQLKNVVCRLENWWYFGFGLREISLLDIPSGMQEDRKTAEAVKTTLSPSGKKKSVGFLFVGWKPFFVGWEKKCRLEKNSSVGYYFFRLEKFACHSRQ